MPLLATIVVWLLDHPSERWGMKYVDPLFRPRWWPWEVAVFPAAVLCWLAWPRAGFVVERHWSLVRYRFRSHAAFAAFAAANGNRTAGVALRSGS